MNAQYPNPFLQHLRECRGPRIVLTDADDLDPYLAEQRGKFRGEAGVVVRPEDTDQVVAVVNLCRQYRVPIVPQGGNTGLVGGAVAKAGSVIVSMERMDRIRAVDSLNRTITVEAGCILANIQAKAADHNLLFPLSLGAEGSCRIGGNLGTNAGGVNVLRYGNARELTLGLEVVLADGRVWNGLTGLRKDNTGYDLKDLFVGSEGTLGLITAAVLKLYPLPSDRQTAMVAVDDPKAAGRLLNMARDRCGEALSAYELMARQVLEFTITHIEGTSDPLAEPHPWYVLLELTGQGAPGTLRPALEDLLGTALEEGGIRDAVLAESLDQARALWYLRETMPESQKFEGPSIKHDVSVPVSQVARFLDEAGGWIEQEIPGARICAFGHMGDGNIHYNFSAPIGMDHGEFQERAKPISRTIFDLVATLGGSFSAEHGVGMIRTEELRHYKGEVAHDLMRAIKTALDPHNLMNPGKMLKTE